MIKFRLSDTARTKAETDLERMRSESKDLTNKADDLVSIIRGNKTLTAVEFEAFNYEWNETLDAIAVVNRQIVVRKHMLLHS